MVKKALSAHYHFPGAVTALQKRIMKTPLWGKAPDVKKHGLAWYAFNSKIKIPDLQSYVLGLH